MSNARNANNALIADVVTSSLPGVAALAGIPTGALPDGIQCYVLSDKTLYRLDKSGTLGTLGAGALVAAQNGGTWVPESGISSTPAGAVNARNTLGSDKAITLTGVGNFLTMPSGGGTFAAEYLGDDWAVNTSNGQLSYLGQAAKIFFSINATMYNGTTVIDTLMSCRVVAAQQNQVVEASAPVAAGSSSFYTMSLSGIISMNHDDSFDVLFAGEISTLTVTKITYTLFAL